MIELQVFFFIIAFVALIIALVAIKYTLNLTTDNVKELDELSNRIDILESKVKTKREYTDNKYYYHVLSQEEMDRLKQLLVEIEDILQGHNVSAKSVKFPSLKLDDIIIKISGCPQTFVEHNGMINDFDLGV